MRWHRPPTTLHELGLFYGDLKKEMVAIDLNKSIQKQEERAEKYKCDGRCYTSTSMCTRVDTCPETCKGEFWATIGAVVILEIKVRMIDNNWFSGVEKRTKQVYMFSKNHINDIVFASRNAALEKVRVVENNYK